MDLTLRYRGPLASCDYDCPYCPFAKRREQIREGLERQDDALAQRPAARARRTSSAFLRRREGASSRRCRISPSSAVTLTMSPGLIASGDVAVQISPCVWTRPLPPGRISPLLRRENPLMPTPPQQPRVFAGALQVKMMGWSRVPSPPQSRSDCPRL